MPKKILFLIFSLLLFTGNLYALETSAIEFKIAKNYFSNILNAQLVIFSGIVAAIVGLYFFFNRLEIEKNVKQVADRNKEETEAKLKKVIEAIAKSIDEKFKDQESKIVRIEADLSRTTASSLDNRKIYNMAFGWWIRAADDYSFLGDEKFIRICLNAAKNSVEKITEPSDLDNDLIGNYQKTMPKIDDKIYKIEKDLLDKAVKSKLEQKPAETT